MCQLVVNFMTDPLTGVSEMRRVTRADGTVAACTWDYRDGMTMLRAFWDSAVAIDPTAPHEGRTMQFCTRAELEELWGAVGLRDVRTGALGVERAYADFDDFWEPFTFGVGPAAPTASHSIPSSATRSVSSALRRLGEPTGGFELTARAWFVAGQRLEARMSYSRAWSHISL